MLQPATTILLWSTEMTNAVGLLVLATLIIYFTIQMYIRGGRNDALEWIILNNELELPTVLHGTLTVEEHKPGIFLRFSESTAEARRLQFQYRWLQGIGRQAIFDEVVFDRSQNVVQFSKNGKIKTYNLREFSAIRMREVSGGRSLLSVWHIELVPNRGQPIPFLTSTLGDRKTGFEHVAPIAKAVSAIMAIPVQVVVAGNIWTPGWPPKSPASASS